MVVKKTNIDFTNELVSSIKKGNLTVSLYQCDPEAYGWEDKCPLFNAFGDVWGAGLILPEKLAGVYAPETNITQSGYSRKHQMGYYSCYEVYSDNEFGYKFARMVRLGGGVIVPVYVYEHSGRSFDYAPYSDRWDSGCVGYMYMKGSSVRDIAGHLLVDGTTNKEKAVAWLKRMVRVLNAWEHRESYAVYCEQADGTGSIFSENILNLDSSFAAFKEKLSQEVLYTGRVRKSSQAKAFADLVNMMEYGYALELSA